MTKRFVADLADKSAADTELGKADRDIGGSTARHRRECRQIGKVEPALRRHEVHQEISKADDIQCLLVIARCGHISSIRRNMFGAGNSLATKMYEIGEFSTMEFRRLDGTAVPLRS